MSKYCMFTKMEELKYRIKEHEGYRDTVYQDHLGNATIGWGHLVTSDDNFQVGITYPEELLEKVFEKDFQRAKEGADSLCKDLPINYIARGVLIEMCFKPANQFKYNKLNQQKNLGKMSILLLYLLLY
jgi:GH24 family phage-related lysozyme (muramidase)